MFRKPFFWVAFAVASLLGVATAVHLFPRAMPFVTLDLKMDRGAALAAARELATRYDWGPEGYRQAADLMSSDTVQAYVELEAGGNEAFARMLREDLFSPYTWRVRLFQEYEAAETLVLFTPAGKPYGFREKLAEDAPGPVLGPDQARRIAERAATESWGVDLNSFSPLEASEEARPGGRVDHTFVYERPDLRLAEARYRLRLVVSGDRFTELTRFVQIPEAFDRRFSEMRSYNELVSGISNGIVLVLYGGGAIVGLFLLLRRRWVVWRPALPWAGAIAALMAGALFSQWPLDWMEYDTAVSAGSFAAQRVIYAILNGLFFGITSLVAIVAGESLTRRAFPRHPQLWRLWSSEGAGSRQVLGRTVGAYLLVGVMVAYLTLLYAFAREHLGWWMPSAALTDPNVVAAYLPWLFPLAISLQAGFIEEVVFRAIPLAGAILLGRRFGGSRYWVGAALVLQALLFGAAHANYPAQPAYARLIEIAIPFAFIGVIYVVFGLLPAIVMHFAFDVLMFSLPLFASSAPAIWMDRTLVVLLALTPLWVVLLIRVRRGPWVELPDALRNGGWSPPPEAEPAAEESGPTLRPALGRGAALGLGAAGLVGLVAWGALTPFRSDAPSLGVTEAEAVERAGVALRERGITLDASWRDLAAVVGDVGLADRFVWQEGGPEAYEAVIGTHIEAPHWAVRAARFEGDVVERAEEYRVHVDAAGEAVRFEHRLPEGRSGGSLSREDARALADRAVRSTLGLDPSTLREVSAEPSERPSRRDWTFTFEDPAVSVGGEGEARLAVTIAGEEVVDVFRHVYVPEEWQRAEQQRASTAALVTNVCGFPVGLGLLTAAIAGLVRWSRGLFARGTFRIVFLGLFAVLALRVLNGWPLLSAGFDTTRSWATQSFIGVGGGLVGAGFLAVLLALVCGFAHRWLPGPGAPTPGATTTAVRGAALGAVWAGLGAAVSAVGPARDPLWGNLQSAAAALPAVGPTLDAVRGWALQTVVILLLVGLAGAVSRDWTRRRPLTALLLVVAGLLLAGAGGVDTVSLWLASGLGTGVVLWLSYALVLRFRPALVPVATAATVVLALGRQAVLAPYPGASAGAALASAAVGALGLWWAGRLDRDTLTAVGGPAQ